MELFQKLNQSTYNKPQGKKSPNQILFSDHLRIDLCLLCVRLLYVLIGAFLLQYMWWIVKSHSTPL